LQLYRYLFNNALSAAEIVWHRMIGEGDFVNSKELRRRQLCNVESRHSPGMSEKNNGKVRWQGFRSRFKSCTSWIWVSWTAEVLLPARVRDFSLLHSVQTSSGTQPFFHWVPWALSPGVNRPGGEADHSPAFSGEVKNGTAVPPLLLYASMLYVLKKLSKRQLYSCLSHFRDCRWSIRFITVNYKPGHSRLQQITTVTIVLLVCSLQEIQEMIV
jgi:hypothetical protein